MTSEECWGISHSDGAGRKLFQGKIKGVQDGTNGTGQSERVDVCVRERSYPVLPGSVCGSNGEALLREPVIMAAVIGPVWVPVVSSAIGGIMAITGGIVTQLIIAGKEKRAHERKIASERAYLGSQLLVSLMEFRDRCRDFADCPAWPGMMIPEHPSILYLGTVNGDWSVLPGALLLRTRRLPVLQEKLIRSLIIALRNTAVVLSMWPSPQNATGYWRGNVRR